MINKRGQEGLGMEKFLKLIIVVVVIAFVLAFFFRADINRYIRNAFPDYTTPEHEEIPIDEIEGICGEGWMKVAKINSEEIEDFGWNSAVGKIKFCDNGECEASKLNDVGLYVDGTSMSADVYFYSGYNLWDFLLSGDSGSFKVGMIKDGVFEIDETFLGGNLDDEFPDSRYFKMLNLANLYMPYVCKEVSEIEGACDVEKIELEKVSERKIRLNAYHNCDLNYLFFDVNVVPYYKSYLGEEFERVSSVESDSVFISGGEFDNSVSYGASGLMLSSVEIEVPASSPEYLSAPAASYNLVWMDVYNKVYDTLLGEDLKLDLKKSEELKLDEKFSRKCIVGSYFGDVDGKKIEEEKTGSGDIGFFLQISDLDICSSHKIIFYKDEDMYSEAFFDKDTALSHKFDNGDYGYFPEGGKLKNGEYRASVFSLKESGELDFVVTYDSIEVKSTIFGRIKNFIFG